MNPFLATDGYKTGHHLMYPKGTTLVYSNFTPRSAKHADGEKIVSFGQQMVMKQIHEMFQKEFFDKKKEPLLDEIQKTYGAYLGASYNTEHIEALHDLGYLPIMVKSIPEGVRVYPGIPVLTIYNTKEEFFWLTNFLETLISTLLWKPMTSASIAYEYKSLLLDYMNLTDKGNDAFVEFQAHDFSMRGMSGVESTISSGLGHATCFMGSDSLPVIEGARRYYGVASSDVPVHSVNATEHSVMCAGGDENELETFRYLMKQFPSGILSIVSDTWNLWDVCTKFLPELKDEILARDGKIVIRPDSGDPADIICGKGGRTFKTTAEIGDFASELFYEGEGTEFFMYRDKMYSISKDRLDEFVSDYGADDSFDYDGCEIQELITGRFSTIEEVDVSIEEQKGVVQLLWETFGGTVNEQGYKVLDSHIGCIYGDSITLARATDICQRLEIAGFATTNVVFGIGSYTYQYNTRDTFGFAMKATYVEIKSNKMDAHGKSYGREIFKDPITDDGTKKSAKGLLRVNYDPLEGNGDWTVDDQVSWAEEGKGMLQPIYTDGKFSPSPWELGEIRALINQEIKDGK